MIQRIVDRMAGNLFFLRGWSVTLVAALFALAAKDTNPRYIFISYLPVLIFWLLDGYFLSQERLFRDLYNHVRKLDEKNIDFSMDITKFKDKSRNGWINSMGAPTLLWFYVPLMLAMLVIMCLLIKK